MSDPKNKGTLFSSTLKVEEKKVVLFFWFEVNLVRYGDFEFVPIWPFLGKNGQKNNFFIEFVVGLKQLEFCSSFFYLIRDSMEL